MPRKHIPKAPQGADHFIYNVYSLRLAVALGSTEQAIIIHDIYLSLRKKALDPEHYSNSFVNGRFWTYDPYKIWTERLFPFQTEETVRTAYFQPLIKTGILLRSNFDYGQSRRSWLTIDFQKMHSMYPFTEEIYPNVTPYPDNKGKNEEERDVTVTLPPIKGASYPDNKGHHTPKIGESIEYINNIYNKTDSSTEYSTVPSISGEKESVREKTIESELNKFLEGYRNLTGTDYKDPDSIKALLYDGQTASDLLELEELVYGFG